MTVSIRARLTAWYTGVVIVALATGTAAVAQVQTRVARNRLDAELARLEHTVIAVLHNEFGEGLDLPGAVREASGEVIVDGRTVVVTGPDGRPVQAWGDRLPAALAVASHDGAADAAANLTVERARYRVMRSLVTHGPWTFTVAVLAPLDALEIERTELLRSLGIGMVVALAVAVVGGWLVGRHALEPAALDAQRQFMADASHQLRTPVSIIRTTAQVILGKEERATAEYRDSMTIVSEQSARLARLVDAMFFLSRADAGGPSLRPEPIYLDDVVQECVRGLGVIARARGVAMEVDGNSDVPLTGDEELLRQMLVNLLENAVRHTPPGRRVRTTIVSVDGTVTIRVADQGPGIARADRERIFERFVRLNGSEGAGLGLPVARWVAQAHGGELVLEASGPDGSVFSVCLPRGHLR